MAAFLSLSGRSASAVEPVQVLAWLFPLNPPPASPAPTPDAVRPIHLAGTDVTFTRARLDDLFTAPDWYPRSHSAMPAVVSSGRPPSVYACGYCHSPSGQGRPENASLAGLPSAYIVRQLSDFKSGARRSALDGPYGPSARMIAVAQALSDQDASAAADYFAQQKLRPRCRVLERSRIPQTHVIGWVYASLPGGGDEPLGERVIEITPDPVRHESRDDTLRYTAYVPPGSVTRGKKIATAGITGATPACSSCHGPDLRGTAMAPPIAGRSPTYLLRQLMAFKTGRRGSTSGVAMQSVAGSLPLTDMINAAAYAGSLNP